MSFETKVLSAITKLRTELTEVKAAIAAVQGSSGTAAPASETVAGVLEVATQAETDTGVDNSRAVTPLKLKTRLLAYAQPLTANLTTLAGIVSGATGRTLLAAADAATAKSALSLAKADVGLSNVDNTSDVNKPVSTAQQTALDLKANQSTVAGLTKASVGLANVDNTSDANKPVSSAQQTALNLKANLTANLVGYGQLETHGTYGDFNDITDFGWHYVVGATNGPDIHTGIPQYYCLSIGLGSEYPFSAYAAQIAYPRNNPGMMATRFREGGGWGPWQKIGGYTKSDVGLGNVDNTSDANKPVSSAQQTALNLKANLASPALTGVPTAPTAAVGTNSTQLATTAFVSSSVAAGLPAVIDGGTP